MPTKLIGPPERQDLAITESSAAYQERMFKAWKPYGSPNLVRSKQTVRPAYTKDMRHLLHSSDETCLDSHLIAVHQPRMFSYCLCELEGEHERLSRVGR